MLQLVLCQNRWLAAHNYYLERTVLQSFLAYNEQGIDTALHVNRHCILTDKVKASEDQMLAV